MYAILSPEGFASILWKDAARSGEACGLIGLTAPELLSRWIIDQVIPEPPDGAHTDPALTSAHVDRALKRDLAALDQEKDLLATRWRKCRKLGVPTIQEEKT